MAGQHGGDLPHQAGIDRRGGVSGDDSRLVRDGQPERQGRTSAESACTALEKLGQACFGGRAVQAHGLADRELQQLKR